MTHPSALSRSLHVALFLTLSAITITAHAADVKAIRQPKPIMVSREVSNHGGQRTSPTEPAGSLTNTYWKPVKLGDQAVTLGAGKKELHMVLVAEGNRARGHSGCNQFTGTLSGCKPTGVCTDGLHHQGLYGRHGASKDVSWMHSTERRSSRSQAIHCCCTTITMTRSCGSRLCIAIERPASRSDESTGQPGPSRSTSPGDPWRLGLVSFTAKLMNTPAPTSM